jgi:hypothetical protein
MSPTLIHYIIKLDSLIVGFHFPVLEVINYSSGTKNDGEIFTLHKATLIYKANGSPLQRLEIKRSWIF